MARHSRKKAARAARPQSASPLKRLESAVKKHRKHIYAASMLVNLLLCLALFDPKPHTGGDNATYIILAESILRSGDGYSDTITPGEPKPHTQYPFGYPLLLAPLVALVGRNLVLLKLFSVLLAVASVALFSRLVERLAPPLAWAGLSLAAASNPVIVDYSHWILSEMSFLFFSLLALYFLIAWDEEEKSRFGKKFWFAVLAMAFTVHIRSAGLAFPIAGFAYFALRRRWRTLAVFTLSLVLLLSPWMIRNRLVREPGVGYMSALFMKNPYTPEQGAAGVADLAARFVTNVRIYSGTELARVLLGSEGVGQESRAVKMVSVAAALLVLIGLIGHLARTFRILEIYMLVFLGMVLIWPEAWSDVRFLMPVVPLIIFYLAEGAALAGRRIWPEIYRNGAAAAAAACVIALLGLGAQALRVPDNLDMVGRYLRGDRYAGYPSNWRNFFEAADWVRQNTPETSVVTVRKPTLFYLHTGRKIEVYPFTTNTDSVLSRITATDYVIVDAVSGTTYRYLVPAIQKAPERFKLVFQKKEPFTGVLEVVR
ncbi:MAG TPA: hypothetical protein VM123_18775 [archaeon]|nr:hypothetical protein [archaeon]